MNNDIVDYNVLLKFKTPNTYGENFSKVPKKPGIYFYATPYYIEDDKYKNEFFYRIIYIGSSKNLYNRYSSHEVGRVLKNLCNIQFYFEETLDYKEFEKKLINHIKPICNYQYNKKNKKRYFSINKNDII
jgi:excinuclease UvrABC nuclease subunit